MKKFLWTLIILIVLGVGLRFISQKTSLLNLVTINTGTQDQTQIANPASVNCTEKGGTSEIITNTDGSQSGLCHLSDGTTCDEWAYYRGECAGIVGNKSKITGGSVSTDKDDHVISKGITHKYVIKTEETINGNDIYVYNEIGNIIFSVQADRGWQRFIDIVNENLIVENGTSHIRTFYVYDINTKKVVFSSSYNNWNYNSTNGIGGEEGGLFVDKEKIIFNYPIGFIFEEKKLPENLPVCPSDRGEDNTGYTETRYFYFEGKRLIKTEEIKCAFFE